MVTGLVSAIVPSYRLLERARAKASARMTKLAQMLTRVRSPLKGDRQSLRERMRKEARLFQETQRFCEAQEAFVAFFEKRMAILRSI
ncbi:MAG: hypothetical protein WCY11_00015 [Novosphingobium sp.]